MQFMLVCVCECLIERVESTVLLRLKSAERRRRRRTVNVKKQDDEDEAGRQRRRRMRRCEQQMIRSSLHKSGKGKHKDKSESTLMIEIVLKSDF